MEDSTHKLFFLPHGSASESNVVDKKWIEWILGITLVLSLKKDALI